MYTHHEALTERDWRWQKRKQANGGTGQLRKALSQMKSLTLDRLT